MALNFQGLLFVNFSTERVNFIFFGTLRGQIWRIFMLKTSLLLLVSAITLSPAQAQSSRTVTYPAVYPFVPMQIGEILGGTEKITEDPDYIKNFNDILDASLSKAQSESQPWGGSFWPMNKGMIADPYESTRLGYFLEIGTISWSKNYNTYSKRKNGVLKNIDKLNENQLKTLAPSEKYDILLGDYDFDLTKRMWDYTQRWGNYKENSFISDLLLVGEDALKIAKDMVEKEWFDSVEDAFLNAFQLRGSLAVEEALRLVKTDKYNTIEEAMPEAIENAVADSENYVLKKKNNLIAWWEGICHGWATAATRVVRPRKSVDIRLPDGRNLKFYPTDIKALVSLLWANSLIQDNKFLDQDGNNIGGGVISQGLRCNLKSPKKDIWGRLYDSEPDPFSKDHKPRCVGIHPAKWHLGLVNLIGKQGRSFVVERKVGEAVDNHPIFKYKMRYFNPYNGKRYKNMDRNIERISDEDQFKQFRHPYSKFVVGVELEFFYVNWVRPNRYITDHEGVDKITKKKVFYDLELGPDMNIVGGQWRAKKVGLAESSEALNHDQPDFFWAISNDYKPFFQELDIEPWTDTTTVPPVSWKEASKPAHEFHYMKKFSFGTGQKCDVVNKRTGKVSQVSCEMEEPRPQPLINVVNKLIELSQ